MPYTRTIPIETIDPIEDDVPGFDDKSNKSKKKKGCKGTKGGVFMLFVYLVCLFLGIMLILGLIHPAFVTNPATDKLDWGKLSLASFIFALLGVIIIWIILSCS